MDASKISESRNVTQGQVKRTLRGMDGRIRHVETLLSNPKIVPAIKENADALANLRAEVANLAAGLAIVARSVPPVDITPSSPPPPEVAS